MASASIPFAQHRSIVCSIQYDDVTLAVAGFRVNNPAGTPLTIHVKHPIRGLIHFNAGVQGTKDYSIPANARFSFTATGVEFPKYLFPAALEIGTAEG